MKQEIIRLARKLVATTSALSILVAFPVSLAQAQDTAFAISNAIGQKSQAQVSPKGVTFVQQREGGSPANQPGPTSGGSIPGTQAPPGGGQPGGQFNPQILQQILQQILICIQKMQEEKEGEMGDGRNNRSQGPRYSIDIMRIVEQSSNGESELISVEPIAVGYGCSAEGCGSVKFLEDSMNTRLFPAAAAKSCERNRETGLLYCSDAPLSASRSTKTRAKRLPVNGITGAPITSISGGELANPLMPASGNGLLTNPFSGGPLGGNAAQGECKDGTCSKPGSSGCTTCGQSGEGGGACGSSGCQTCGQGGGEGGGGGGGGGGEGGMGGQGKQQIMQIAMQILGGMLGGLLGGGGGGGSGQAPNNSSDPQLIPTPIPTPEPITDTDRDGVVDDYDNCPKKANPTQSDGDRDGDGDACDTSGSEESPSDDKDNDGIPNDRDNCPHNANYSQADTDGNGVGNACDSRF